MCSISMMRNHPFGKQLSGHIPSPVFKKILYTYFQSTDTFGRWNSNYTLCQFPSFPHQTADLNVPRGANPCVLVRKGFLRNPECHRYCNPFGPLPGPTLIPVAMTSFRTCWELFLRKCPQNVCMSYPPSHIVLLPRFFVRVHSTGSLSHTLRSLPGATGQGLCPTDWTAEMWHLKGMAVEAAVILRTAAAGQFITPGAYESNCSFIIPSSQCKIYSDSSAARKQRLSGPSLEGKQSKTWKPGGNFIQCLRQSGQGPGPLLSQI